MCERRSMDYLIRGTINGLNARFMLADTSRLVETGVKLHDLNPVSSFLFARALTVASLTVPLLEGGEKHTLRWRYAGRVGTMIAEANAAGDIRGIPPTGGVSVDIADESELYGDSGLISVMRSEDAKILNSGQAEAALLDVVADMAFFFSTSDQVETEMRALVGFNPDPAHPVAISAGFMLQAMPGCDLGEFDVVRREMTTDAFNAILGSKEFAEETKLKRLVELLTGEKNAFDFHFGASLGYRCPCDIDKMRVALRTLPEDELKEIAAENEKLRIKCQFCSKTYVFDASLENAEVVRDGGRTSDD